MQRRIENPGDHRQLSAIKCLHKKLNLRFLTLKDPFISESCIEIKIKLKFYFHTSLWCLKRFYEGLKGVKG